MLGLCRKISAGKSCMMTSHRSSHVVRTKLGLLLLRELFGNNNNIIQRFLKDVSFTACWKGRNHNLDQLSPLFDQNFISASGVHVVPLTSRLMTEYVCLCLSVWATGTQKTWDISQIRALHDTRKILYYIFITFKYHHGKRKTYTMLPKTLVPAILWGGTSAWLGLLLWK